MEESEEKIEMSVNDQKEVAIGDKDFQGKGETEVATSSTNTSKLPSYVDIHAFRAKHAGDVRRFGARKSVKCRRPQFVIVDVQPAESSSTSAQHMNNRQPNSMPGLETITVPEIDKTAEPKCDIAYDQQLQMT